MRFKNKVCIVTGGNSGIGKATCLKLVQEGAKVVIVGRDEKSGRDVEKEIIDKGGKAFFISADIGRTKNIEEVVAVTLQKWSTIDILVNNAAIMTYEPIIELSEDKWDKLMSVNLKAVFVFCKLCIPYMKNGAM